MPVSSGLQKYFDSQRQKKGDVKKKLDSLEGQIDPAFLKSFSEFHDRIMGIVGENPDAEEEVEEDLDQLGQQLSETNQKHRLQKAASIIKHSEK